MNDVDRENIIRAATFSASRRSDGVIEVPIPPGPVAMALVEMAMELDMSIQQVVIHAIKTYQLQLKGKPLPPPLEPGYFQEGD